MVTPTVNEWSLGGAFILKHEKFLRWQAVHDPYRGCPTGFTTAAPRTGP